MKKTKSSLVVQYATIDQMAANWGSNIVARKEIGRFSGGALSPKTLANMDSRGEGPKGAFILCNQKVYPVESITEFLKARVQYKWSKWSPGQVKADT